MRFGCSVLAFLACVLLANCSRRAEPEIFLTGWQYYSNEGMACVESLYSVELSFMNEERRKALCDGRARLFFKYGRRLIEIPNRNIDGCRIHSNALEVTLRESYPGLARSYIKFCPDGCDSVEYDSNKPLIEEIYPPFTLSPLEITRLELLYVDHLAIDDTLRITLQ